MVAIKICGVRSAEHALAAAAAGADMLGVIFAPSRRQVSADEAAAIRAALDTLPRRPDLAGVFVNAAPDLIAQTIEQCGLDIVQLSGDEPMSLLHALPGRRILKSVRLDDRPSERDWLRPGPQHDHVRLHVDAHVPGAYGGTGAIADWARAAEVARHAPILLAGGLTPANVAEAIRQVRPWGVDVSSGVETDGVKDVEKIRAFIAAARAAGLAIDNQEGG